jgi:hypothetical protein
MPAVQLNRVLIKGGPPPQVRDTGPLFGLVRRP